MDNYKIKVKDEQDFKEVVSLVNTLGYGINFLYSNASGEVVKGLFLKSNWLVEWTHRDTYFDFNDSKELTLPQLRDLVVLKRNDINDANWETEGGDQIFNDSNNKSYIYRADGWDELQRHEMRQAMWEKPRSIAKPQDPALISGAEAKLAWVNGEEVEYQNKLDSDVWILIDDTNTLGVFSKEQFIFRLKPQTIKLELELPKPFEPQMGDRYWIIHPAFKRGYTEGIFGEADKHEAFQQFGAYRTEDDVKKAVEQLRKIRGAS